MLTRVAVLLLLATTATAKPVPTDDDLRARAAAIVQGLAGLDQLDEPGVTQVMAGHAARDGQTSPYRREWEYPATPVFASATLIVGGANPVTGNNDAWRAMLLVPDARLGLELAHIDPVLLDAPYEMRPSLPHIAGGVRKPPAIEHRFHVRSAELRVLATPEGRISRIVFTTERAIPADRPTLRAQIRARGIRPGVSR